MRFIPTTSRNRVRASAEPQFFREQGGGELAILYIAAFSKSGGDASTTFNEPKGIGFGAIVPTRRQRLLQTAELGHRLPDQRLHAALIRSSEGPLSVLRAPTC